MLVVVVVVGNGGGGLRLVKRLQRLLMTWILLDEAMVAFFLAFFLRLESMNSLTLIMDLER